MSVGIFFQMNGRYSISFTLFLTCLFFSPLLMEATSFSVEPIPINQDKNNSLFALSSPMINVFGIIYCVIKGTGIVFFCVSAVGSS